MKKLISLIIISFCSFSLSAQTDISEELKLLSESDQYSRILENYTKDYTVYSAKSLYYIGLAYYMTGDDTNCLKIMDLSIKKDPNDPAPYHIKASTLNYMQKYEEAILHFKKAIELNPDRSQSYTGTGDSYYNLKKYDLAIEYYKKATEQSDVTDGRPFYMVGQIYYDIGDYDSALQAFYTTKSNISYDSYYYINTLFNIGLLESLKQNYDKAEPIFIEILQLAPNDYHVYAKLIQIYYHRKDYEKAQPYKDKLYEAHKQGLLNKNMEDMFCFDQFTWNDKLVQVFERFETGPKDSIFYKHLFYIVNKDNEIEYRIQTEYSPVAIALDGITYLLGMTKGDTHSTFGIGFKEDFKYDDLKNAVIQILEEKIESSSSSVLKKE